MGEASCNPSGRKSYTHTHTHIHSYTYLYTHIHTHTNTSLCALLRPQIIRQTRREREREREREKERERERGTANDPAGANMSVDEGSISGGSESSSIRSADTSSGSMCAGMDPGGIFKPSPPPKDTWTELLLRAAVMDTV